MADASGQADIRGIDVQKLAMAYELEARIFKKYVTVVPTSAREIRWYQKTSGFLSGPTTSGMTSEYIDNNDQLALPVVVEQSFTRNTSYVRKYFLTTATISDEDIKDSDPDVWMVHLRDTVFAVERRVDARIWNVSTEDQSAVNINTNATNAAWNAASYTGVNAVEDIMEAIMNIRTNTNEELTNGYLFLSPLDHKSLLTWLIDGKGSSVPSFASSKLVSGEIQEILGLKVVVSTHVTADYALVADLAKAVKWKTFTPISTAVLDDPGIGKRIRVWEEGEAILERPKFCSLITNTQA